MADITGITAVRPTSTVEYDLVELGATVAVGDLLYEDTNDNSYKLAAANVDAPTAAAKAMAVTPGVDGDSALVITKGPVDLVGATLAQGESYAVSTNAGKTAPETDLTTGNFVTRSGTASSTSRIDLDFQATGYTHA